MTAASDLQGAGLQRASAVTGQRRFAEIAERLRYPLAVYLISRVLYLAVAVLDIPLRNEPLGAGLRNWDGKWYVLLAQNGYPHNIPNGYGHYSTLGFEPFYSMLMWLGGTILPRGVEASGLFISLVTGAIATIEMSILARRWWGLEASRRGVLFFCFFPGTIVFSMVYSEGLMLALVAGAILCLEDRRWVLAGLLAGLATAVEPVALAIIPACAAVSLRELWRSGAAQPPGPRRVLAGGRDPAACRSLWAPVLSTFGAVGAGIFFWFWVGTPLASYRAQKIAWGEKSSPLASYLQLRTFSREFSRWHGWHDVNLNLLSGFLGALFLFWALWQMWKLRRGLAAGEAAGTGRVGGGISLGAWVWTLVVAVLALTSDQTPPNPRMLVCAFPVLFAVAAPRVGWRQKVLLGIALILLVAMSIATFAHITLRP